MLDSQKDLHYLLCEIRHHIVSKAKNLGIGSEAEEATGNDEGPAEVAADRDSMGSWRRLSEPEGTQWGMQVTETLRQW